MNQKQYLFTGDSITDAGHLWENDTRLLGHGFVRKLASFPTLQHQTLVNRGQDGFTSADLLRLLRRCTDLDRFDVITILIGINDVSVAYYTNTDWIPDTFARNMEEIFHLLSSASHAKLVFMEPFLFTPPDSHLHLFPLLHTAQHILQTLADSHHALYIPLQEALAEAAAVSGTDAVSVDGIHLTDAGNQILADCFYQAAETAGLF